jgi:hypothetical protein
MKTADALTVLSTAFLLPPFSSIAAFRTFVSSFTFVIIENLI